MNKNAVKNTPKACPAACPKSSKINFTDATIRHLACPEKRKIYWCKGLAGFGIRVTPKGSKTWIYVFKHEGISKTYTIGKYPRLSLAQAREKYCELRDKSERGKDPITEKKENAKKDREALTVTELIDKYIEFCQAKGEKMWKEKKRALVRDAVPHIGKMRVHDVTFRDISPIINLIFLERQSAQSAKHQLSYLRTMFKYAKNGLGLIELNPCADLVPPARVRKKPPRALEPHEIFLFWNNMDNSNMTHVVKLGMKFMLCTLQRGVEVRNMEWSEVNRKENIWVIPSHKAKNGKRHLVPLNQFAVSILDEIHQYTGHSEYVFGYNNLWKMKPDARPNLKPMSITAFNHSSRVNFDCYGIGEYFTPHDLRKTGATRLTSVGFPRDIVSKILNHTPPDVTSQVYDLFDYYEEKRAGMECMNHMLERILSCESVDHVPTAKALRQEFMTKGLVYQFLKEEHYTTKKTDTKQGFQTTLLSPVSYTLSASLDV